MPHLGFEPTPSLPEFFRRHLIRPLGRSANDGGDPAAIFEQTTLVLWLEADIGETGEMEHCPKAIASVGEVVAGYRCARGRIQAAKNHVEASGEDIRLIPDQANPVPLHRAASNGFMVRQRAPENRTEASCKE